MEVKHLSKTRRLTSAQADAAVAWTCMISPVNNEMFNIQCVV